MALVSGLFITAVFISSAIANDIDLFWNEGPAPGAPDDLAPTDALAAEETRPGPTMVPGVKTPKVPRFGKHIEAADPWEINEERNCDPTAKPGMIAFRSMLRRTYDSRRSAGIIRACSGEPTVKESGHYSGRALDWMVNPTSAKHRAEANTIVSWLLAPDEHGNEYAMARRFNLMYLIWDDQIFKLYQPEKGWAQYRNCYSAAMQRKSAGTYCHRDHIHISMGWKGAHKQSSYFHPSSTFQEPKTSPNAAPGPGAKPPECDLAAPATPAAPKAVPAGFKPMTPMRLLDTRKDLKNVGAQVHCRATPGKEFSLSLDDVGIKPGQASAVAVNVTATGSGGPGWVAVYPNGAEWGGTSTVNYAGGDDVAASAIVPVGVGNAITVKTGVHDVDLVLDVTGYFPTDGSGQTYHPAGPKRFLDSGIAARRWTQVPLSGAPEGTTGVVANITGDSPSARSFVSALGAKPAEGKVPSTSTVNPGPKRATANRAMLASDGKALWLYGNVKQRALVDVTGWFAPGGLKFSPVTPVRLLDSRGAVGDKEPLLSGVRTLDSNSEPARVQVAGHAGVPESAKAVVVTVTMVNSTHGTYLTAWGKGGRPKTSDLNVVAKQPQGNMAIVELDDDGLAQFAIGFGQSDYVVDVLGYLK